MTEVITQEKLDFLEEAGSESEEDRRAARQLLAEAQGNTDGHKPVDVVNEQTGETKKIDVKSVGHVATIGVRVENGADIGLDHWSRNEHR